LRRFVEACRACRSDDRFITARTLLDGTFPSENEFIDQINANRPRPQPRLNGNAAASDHAAV
jgi:hypothetical protein